MQGFLSGKRREDKSGRDWSKHFESDCHLRRCWLSGAYCLNASRSKEIPLADLKEIVAIGYAGMAGPLTILANGQAGAFSRMASNNE